MTDLTTPGEIGAAADNKSTAHAISKAGGHNGYVVDGIDIARFYSEVETSNINGFAQVTTSGLDLTLDGGEAFVAGWLCRDRRTTISLPASETNTVYVGYNPDSVLSEGESPAENDNIIIGTDTHFTDDDPKLGLYEVETGSTSITSVTDIRPMSRAEADGPWRKVDEAIGTVPGPLAVESDTRRDHIRVDRPDVGAWDLTATTDNGGAFQLTGAGTTTGSFAFTESGHLRMQRPGTWAVESPNQITVYPQYGDPTEDDDKTVEEGDIWIRIN